MADVRRCFRPRDSRRWWACGQNATIHFHGADPTCFSSCTFAVVGVLTALYLFLGVPPNCAPAPSPADEEARHDFANLSGLTDGAGVRFCSRTTCDLDLHIFSVRFQAFGRMMQDGGSRHVVLALPDKVREQAARTCAIRRICHFFVSLSLCCKARHYRLGCHASSYVSSHLGRGRVALFPSAAIAAGSAWHAQSCFCLISLLCVGAP